MSIHDDDVATLPRGLGWFGVGLGVAQLAAPDVVNCLIGVQPTDDNRAILRASGRRELVAGLTILSKGEPSGTWLARMAGLAKGSPRSVEALGPTDDAIDVAAHRAADEPAIA